MFCMMTAHADIVNDEVFLPICCFRTQFLPYRMPLYTLFLGVGTELVRSWYGVDTEKTYGKYTQLSQVG